MTARAAKIRADYYAVRAELTEEALFKPLAAWHHERGMLVGADQSHPARAGFPAQSTQIYTDYFRTHRWYGAAGSDHHGDSKVHSSMAHLYGHERVWIEAFHSSGWGGTLADTYDWLLPFLRSGANLYNPHASYFGTAGGWFEWAPPSTDWRQPYWQQYPAFSRAVARICSIMSWGTYSADVAVLHPTATMQSLIPLDAPVQHFGDGRLGDDHADVDETQRHYLDLCGTNNWLAPHLGSLDRHRIAFDIIDDASVQRATAAEGALRVTDLSYRAVLLPSASVLEEETARRLTQLLDAGGRVVIVGRPPATAAGMTGDDSVVAALLKHPRLERASDAEAGAAAVADTSGHATGGVPLLVRREGVEAVALVTGAFPDARAQPGDSDHEADPARYARHSTVTVQAAVTEAEIWNPANGTRRPAQVTVTEGRSTIEVPLEGAPAVLVVWREGTPQPHRPTTPTPLPERAIDLSTGWEGRLVPTMDNTWGDLALPVGSSVAEPQIWTMRWTETEDPDANWQQTRATCGNRVRVLPPVPSAEAPDPLGAPAVEEVLAGHLPPHPGRLERLAVLLQPGHPGPGRSARQQGPGDRGVRTRSRARARYGRPGPRDRGDGPPRPRRTAHRRRGHQARVVERRGTRHRHRVSRLRPRGDRPDPPRPRIRAGDAQDRPMLISGAADTPLGSYFCLSRPDAFGPRPQFMCLPEDVRPSGGVTYRGRLNAVGQAVLVVGAAVGVTVLLDGAVVARQEKVEYYESDWGAVPMFFRHQLALGDGEHVLEVVADAVDPREAVFVDCVADAANHLVSGAGWEAETGEWRGRTDEHVGRWGSCSTATRPYGRTRCRTPSGSPAHLCWGVPCCRCGPRIPCANTPSASASPCRRGPYRWTCRWSWRRVCGSVTARRWGSAVRS